MPFPTTRPQFDDLTAVPTGYCLVNVIVMVNPEDRFGSVVGLTGAHSPEV